MKSKYTKAIFLIIFVFMISAYWGVWNGFFQQDEWSAFGKYFSINVGSFPEVINYLFKPEVTHYVPFTRLVFFITFSLFKLNYTYWAVLSVAYHLLIVITLYYLAKLIFHDKILPICTVLLFGFNGAGYQATAWSVADLPTHGATLLTLLSLIFLIRYIKDTSPRNFYYAILFFVGSLFFKEIFLAGIGFLFFAAVYKKGVSFKNKELIATVLLFGFYLVLRLVMIASAGPSADTVLAGSRIDLFRNLATFPYKVFAQSLIPIPQLLFFSNMLVGYIPEFLTGPKASFNSLLFAQKQMIEVLSFLVTAVSLLVTALFYRDQKNRKMIRIAFTAIAFLFLNSFVYAFSPDRSGIVSIMDSRNLYLPLIGACVFITAIFAVIKRYSSRFAYLLLTILLIINIYWLEKGLYELSVSGQERKEILVDIKDRYPRLGKKVIFYTESDQSFYGLPESEKILPFQSGLGQTLLVWYQSSENFPPAFFSNRFLWEITEQGYKQSLPSGEGKEINERGFGYFRDMELMSKTMKKYKLSPDIVYAISYKAKDKRISDITAKTRSILKGAVGDTIRIYPIAVDSSQNQKELQNMFDGKEETFWSTEKPYSGGESIVMDLGKEFNLVKFSLDVHNNINQIAVGFQVLLSNDQKTWTEVFNEKKYVPNKNGAINIFISPQKARYAKIVQLGYHLSAPWVIHELSVYAKSN